MQFNLIPLLLAASLLFAASVAQFGDDNDDDNDDDSDDDVNDLISYLTGGAAEDLEHDVDEIESHNSQQMDYDLDDTADDLSDGHQLMFRDIDHISSALHADKREHFEALSAGYGRPQPNMYSHAKPAKKAAKGYAKGASRPLAGDGPPQDPPAPPAVATKPPSFDDFNNSKPQNDGNCLHAVNRERQAAGVPELTHNQTLVDLAAKHASYMAASQALSHDGFWSYRFDAVPAGVIGVGELVVADDLSRTPNGPAKRAVDRWMGSIEHKALLLRPDMFILGCSTAQGSDGRFYATAIICSK